MVYKIDRMADGANMVWQYLSFFQTGVIVSSILRPHPYDNIRSA